MDKTLEEVIQEYVSQGNLTTREVISTGDGWELSLTPSNYFGEQPRDYRDYANDSMCKRISIDEWICTRIKGHSGPHVASVSVTDGRDMYIDIW